MSETKKPDPKAEALKVLEKAEEENTKAFQTELKALLDKYEYDLSISPPQVQLVKRK